MGQLELRTLEHSTNHAPLGLFAAPCRPALNLSTNFSTSPKSPSSKLIKLLLLQAGKEEEGEIAVVTSLKYERCSDATGMMARL